MKDLIVLYFILAETLEVFSGGWRMIPPRQEATSVLCWQHILTSVVIVYSYLSGKYLSIMFKQYKASTKPNTILLPQFYLYILP